MRVPKRKTSKYKTTDFRSHLNINCFFPVCPMTRPQKINKKQIKKSQHKIIKKGEAERTIPKINRILPRRQPDSFEGIVGPQDFCLFPVDRGLPIFMETVVVDQKFPTIKMGLESNGIHIKTLHDKVRRIVLNPQRLRRSFVILSEAKNLFSFGFFVASLLPGPHITNAGAGRMTGI